MKIIKSNNILIHLFTSYVIFIFVLILFGDGLDRVESYSVSCFAAFLSITYLSYKFYKLYQINLLNIIIIGMFIKLLIGFMFWQFYLWPEYFNQNSIIVFDHFEYLQTPSSMEKIAKYRIENGFFSIPLQQFLYQGKYFFINYIMSNLYLSGNFNLLDLSVQNTLFSIYTAILISLIGVKFDLNIKQIRNIFVISFFQPFSLISSMMWRDVTGQFFFMLGFYLFINSFNSKIMKISASLVLASLTMALLRTVYIFIPFFLYFVRYVKSGMLSTKQNIILIVLLIVLFFVTSRMQLLEFLSAGYSYYFSALTNINSFLLLPLTYFQVLIGPFPWTNWLEFSDNTIFFPTNYLQAIYVITILYFTIKYYKYSASNIKIYIVLTFFLLLNMATITSDIHTEYFTFAVGLLLPISAKYFSTGRFIMVYGIVFIGFLILNIIYVFLGVNGAGLHAIL